MQGYYGGLIVVIFYGGGGSPPEEFYLITHTNLDILTQTSQRILIHQ
jgi:hypothetical protein